MSASENAVILYENIYVDKEDELLLSRVWGCQAVAELDVEQHRSSDKAVPHKGPVRKIADHTEVAAPKSSQSYPTIHHAHPVLCLYLGARVGGGQPPQPALHPKPISLFALLSAHPRCAVRHRNPRRELSTAIFRSFRAPRDFA